MNAIVPETRIALAQPRWIDRIAAALREWNTRAAVHAARAPLPFADADAIIRKARADRAAYLSRVVR